MNSSSREAKESPVHQGADEILAYSITTTPWVAAPTSPTAKIFSYVDDTYTDVTATNMSGSASVSGDVITTPTVTGLTAGTMYRVEVKFAVSGNTFEVWFWLQGER